MYSIAETGCSKPSNAEYQLPNPLVGLEILVWFVRLDGDKRSCAAGTRLRPRIVRIVKGDCTCDNGEHVRSKTFPVAI